MRRRCGAVPTRRFRLKRLRRPSSCCTADSQYADGRFGWPRWSADLELSWLPVHTLPGPGTALVPASFVYMTYAGERPEEFLCPSTSNGLAAGPDLSSAILHGLLELIERDAFLISWTNRLMPTHIDLSDDRGVCGRIVAHYAHFNVDVRVFDVSVGLPPYTMMAIAFDRKGPGPSAVVGLGCHLDPMISWSGARSSRSARCGRLRPGG